MTAEIWTAAAKLASLLANVPVTRQYLSGQK